MIRAHGRLPDQIRPIKVSYDTIEHASASVFFEQGKTKVLCAVTLQNSVPPFLKGKKTGWLTAEYAMLPAATHVRKERDMAGSKPNGRSIEISRLIGRVLRSVVNLDALGERTIVVDCDVIQADGSTRTACITAASIALHMAVQRWINTGKLPEQIIVQEVAAVSVGYSNATVLLDLDFAEDSVIDADFNFIMTRSGKIIEIQGSAEKSPIAWDIVETMQKFAYKGVGDIFNALAAPSHEIRPEKHDAPRQPFNKIRVRTEPAV